MTLAGWRDSRGSFHYGVWFGRRFLGLRYQRGGDTIPRRGPEIAVFAKGWGQS